MRGIVFFVAIVCLLLGLQSCSSAVDFKKMQGTAWETDSIYDYYNGFGYMSRNPYPKEIFRFREDSIVSHEGMDRALLFHYTTTDSSLLFRDLQGNLVSDFKVIELTEKKMILKKNKKFLFPGNNQERYEIRFFSKIDSVKK